MRKKNLAQSYEELKTELDICKVGGLFLALYRDSTAPLRIINRLKQDLPEMFQLDINIDEQKVWFPLFFSMTFEQMGKKSTIFHVIGL